MLKKGLLLVLILIVCTVFVSAEIVNLSKTPSRSSVHPSVLAYGSKVMVVWREEQVWDTYYTIYSDGVWSNPVPAFDTSVISKNPHIVLGSDGAVHMTWGEGNSSSVREINYGFYKNGEWQGQTEIFTSLGSNSNWPRIGVFTDNTVNITWTSEKSNVYDQVIRNNWKVIGAAWANGVVVNNKLAKDSSGHSDIYTRWNTAYAVWREGVTGDGWNIKFAQKSQTGAWSYPLRINDTAGTHSYARVTVDPKGNVHVLWENFQKVRYANRINGAWSGSTQINVAPGKHPNFLDIDADSASNIHACYVSNVSDTRRDIYYNFKPSDGNWVPSDEQRLSTSSTANQLPAISVDDAGGAHVVWASQGEGVAGDIMYTKIGGNLQTIDITTPAGGEKYYVDNRIPIAWDSEGITGDVKVNVRRLDGSGGYVVSAATPYNSSPVTYIVPNDMIGGYYFARVKQGEIVGESETFSIPQIAFTADYTGLSYGAGGPLIASWIARAIEGTVKITLRRTDGSDGYVLAAAAPNDGSPFTCTIPADTVPASYFLRLKADGVLCESGNFTVMIPEINVTAPTSSQSVNIGEQVTTEWSTVGMAGSVSVVLQKADNSVSYVISNSVPYNGSPYSFSIPCEAVTGQYNVKVEQGAVNDVSENFTVDPSTTSITVTYPNGGEEARAGSIQTLTWTSTGTIANVKMEFSPDAGANWGTLIDSTPNSGTYTGLIPAESPASDRCLVRVSDAIDGCPRDTSDSTFTLLPALPINVVAPFGGETFNVGGIITIGWTTSGITGDVRIILRRADGTNGYEIEAAYPYNGAPYYYTIPGTVEPATYFIRVKQGDFVSESNNFTIDPAIAP